MPHLHEDFGFFFGMRESGKKNQNQTTEMGDDS